MQCVDPEVNDTIWPVAAGATFDVDGDLRLRGPTPRGPPGSNYEARPNILMFGDWKWISRRTDEQEGRLDAFCLNTLAPGVPFVVIEVGAGKDLLFCYRCCAGACLHFIHHVCKALKLRLQKSGFCDQDTSAFIRFI